MENTLKITKEQIKVEDGKVYVDSAELANAIQSEEMDVFSEEEAGGNNCFCISIG